MPSKWIARMLCYSVSFIIRNIFLSLASLAFYAPLIAEVLVGEALCRAPAVLRVEELVARAVVVRVELEQAPAAGLALDAAVGVPDRGVLCAGWFDVPARRAVREKDGRGVVDELLAVELCEGLEIGGSVCAERGRRRERLRAAYLYAGD